MKKLITIKVRGYRVKQYRSAVMFYLIARNNTDIYCFSKPIEKPMTKWQLRKFAKGWLKWKRNS